VNFSRHDGAQSFAVCEAATVGVEEPPPGPKSRQLSAIYPNPMRASALMRFDLPAEEAVTLEVFNVQGRRVSELARGVFPAGPQYALWRGLDEQGHELPSGVYFVRLRAGGEEDVRKLMVRR
jgi:hypothetical protein